MDELVDEERRGAGHAAAHEAEIGLLHGARRDQPVAEGDQQPPVLAGVGVLHRGDLGRIDRIGRCDHQPRMKRPLRRAGLRRRQRLRPRVEGLEELLGDAELAAFRPLQKEMA